MELNDTVRVKLTAAGAEIINEEHKTYNSMFSSHHWKDDYKEGDEYSDQLWSLFQIYGKAMSHGSPTYFTNLEKE